MSIFFNTDLVSVLMKCCAMYSNNQVVVPMLETRWDDNLQMQHKTVIRSNEAEIKEFNHLTSKYKSFVLA